MPAPGHHADRFVRRVHRRVVAARAAETMGICVAAAAVVALPLLALSLLRDYSPWPALRILFPAALAIGLAGAWVRRPRLLATAVDADRRLRLSDLLATALLVRRRPAPGPIESSILAAADARALALSPRAVGVARLGPRAWAGVGVLCGLTAVAALAAATADPAAFAGSGAQADAGNPDRASGDGWRDRPTLVFGIPTPALRAGDEGNDDGPGRAADTTDGDATGADANAEARNANRAPADAAGGAGTGSAHTDGGPRNPAALDAAASTGRNPSDSGTAAGGTGIALPGSDGVAGASAGGARAGEAAKGAAAPPWRTAGWPAASAAALGAAQSGQLAPADRDIVRAYFGRRD